MSNRKEQYLTYISKLKASGKEVVAYNCPHCNAKLETLAPPPGEIYDSAVVCYECELLHFKVVEDGTVTTKKM